MRRIDLDWSRLLGFDQLTDESPEARLGRLAKVGGSKSNASPDPDAAHRASLALLAKVGNGKVGIVKQA